MGCLQSVSHLQRLFSSQQPQLTLEYIGFLINDMTKKVASKQK